MWHLQYNIVNAPVGAEQGGATVDSFYPFFQVVNYLA